MTIKDARSEFSALITNSPTPRLDIDVILAHILRQDKSYLLLNLNKELSFKQISTLKKAVAKRKKGLPVAYIINCKEFYGFNFYVSPDTLIPKPDTETLVELALNYISGKTLKNLTICDMCCGSGCIGISVLKVLFERQCLNPNFINEFIFADISSAALKITKKNILLLIPSEMRNKIKLVKSNLFLNVDKTFDIILTNPPYIPSKEAKALLKDGRNEPLLAIDGDISIDGKPTFKNDGLGIIENLLVQIYEKLNSGGIFFMETGEYNAEKAASLAEKTGFTDISIHKDMAAQLRVIKALKP